MQTRLKKNTNLQGWIILLPFRQTAVVEDQCVEVAQIQQSIKRRQIQQNNLAQKTDFNGDYVNVPTFADYVISTSLVM